MEPTASVVRSCADRVASTVADLYDVPDLTPVLSDLAKEVAARTEDGRALDIARLREAGLDADLIARILRAVLFEFMEALGAELEEAEFSAAVLALRKCLQQAIPHPEIDPKDVEFYRRLVEGDCSSLNPDHCRLMGLFHELTATFDDVVYVHDLNGMVLYVNQSGLDSTGFTADDIRNGLSVYDFVVPKYADLVGARIESPGSASRSPYGIEIYAKDGERVPIEITTRCVTREGQIVGVLGRARDLRLERRLEDEIRRANAYVDQLVANAPCGIMRADREYMIVEANPVAVAMIGARDAHALSGVPALGLCRGDGSALREILDEALSKQEVIRRRFSETTSCGVALDCDLIVVPVCVGPGCIEEFVILLVADPGPSV